jgi:hypothetical protein
MAIRGFDPRGAAGEAAGMAGGALRGAVKGQVNQFVGGAINSVVGQSPLIGSALGAAKQIGGAAFNGSDKKRANDEAEAQGLKKGNKTLIETDLEILAFFKKRAASEDAEKKRERAFREEEKKEQTKLFQDILKALQNLKLGESSNTTNNRLPFFGLGTMLGALTSRIAKMLNALKRIFTSLPRGIKSIFDNFKNSKLFKTMSALFGSLNERFKGALDKFKKSKFGKSLTNLTDSIKTSFDNLKTRFNNSKFGKSLTGLTDSIKTSFDNLKTDFKSSFNTKVMSPLVGMLDELKLQFALGKAEMKNSKVGTSVKGFFDNLKAKVNSILPEKSITKSVSGAGDSVKGLTGIFDSIPNGFKAMKAKLGAGPLGKAIKGLSNFSDLTPILRGVGRALGPLSIIISIFDFIGGALDDEGIKQSLGMPDGVSEITMRDRISGGLGGFFGGFASIIDMLGSILGIDMKVNVEGLGQVTVGKAVSHYVTKFFGGENGVLQRMNEALKAAGRLLVGDFDGFFKNRLIADTMATLTNVFDSMFTGIKTSTIGMMASLLEVINRATTFELDLGPLGTFTSNGLGGDAAQSLRDRQAQIQGEFETRRQRRLSEVRVRQLEQRRTDGSISADETIELQDLQNFLNLPEFSNGTETTPGSGIFEFRDFGPEGQLAILHNNEAVIPLDAVMEAVRRQESSNNYSAQATTSSASGAYQFIDSTWQEQSRRAGIGTEYTRAMYAPPEVQDAVARDYMSRILRENSGDLAALANTWFTGNAAGQMSQKGVDANRALGNNAAEITAAYRNKFFRNVGEVAGVNAVPGDTIASAVVVGSEATVTAIASTGDEAQDLQLRLAEERRILDEQLNGNITTAIDKSANRIGQIVNSSIMKYFNKVTGGQGGNFFESAIDGIFRGKDLGPLEFLREDFKAITGDFIQIAGNEIGQFLGTDKFSGPQGMDAMASIVSFFTADSREQKGAAVRSFGAAMGAPTDLPGLITSLAGGSANVGGFTKGIANSVSGFAKEKVGTILTKQGTPAAAKLATELGVTTGQQLATGAGLQAAKKSGASLANVSTGAEQVGLLDSIGTALTDLKTVVNNIGKIGSGTLGADGIFAGTADPSAMAGNFGSFLGSYAAQALGLGTNDPVIDGIAGIAGGMLGAAALGTGAVAGSFLGTAAGAISGALGGGALGALAVGGIFTLGAIAIVGLLFGKKKPKDRRVHYMVNLESGAVTYLKGENEEHDHAKAAKSLGNFIAKYYASMKTKTGLDPAGNHPGLDIINEVSVGARHGIHVTFAKDARREYGKDGKEAGKKIAKDILAFFRDKAEENSKLRKDLQAMINSNAGIGQLMYASEFLGGMPIPEIGGSGYVDLTSALVNSMSSSGDGANITNTSTTSSAYTNTALTSTLGSGVSGVVNEYLSNESIRQGNMFTEPGINGGPTEVTTNVVNNTDQSQNSTVVNNSNMRDSELSSISSVALEH